MVCLGKFSHFHYFADLNLAREQTVDIVEQAQVRRMGHHGDDQPARERQPSDAALCPP